MGNGENPGKSPKQSKNEPITEIRPKIRIHCGMKQMIGAAPSLLGNFERQ
jgi:hypothetical protein